MDFIEALPKMGGKSVILTVVSRLPKYAHFIPIAHPYTATSVAQYFFNEIVSTDYHDPSLAIEMLFSLADFGRNYFVSRQSIFT